MMEGKTVTVTVSDEKSNRQRTVEMDTRNILFVFSGAFVGIENTKAQIWQSD